MLRLVTWLISSALSLVRAPISKYWWMNTVQVDSKNKHHPVFHGIPTVGWILHQCFSVQADYYKTKKSKQDIWADRGASFPYLVNRKTVHTMQRSKGTNSKNDQILLPLRSTGLCFLPQRWSIGVCLIIKNIYIQFARRELKM